MSLRVRKTSVAVSRKMDTLVRQRDINFSAALRQIVLSYDYLVAAGRHSLGARRLAYFSHRQDKLWRAWRDIEPDETRLGEILLLNVAEGELRARLEDLEVIELIALYDAVLQRARAA